ncbi:uncharacterized protein LOC129602151 [Paramacrobiotus metropolitanus]|uniref:uncharacterized protein LOC129602151 n=1 Tax=Paramacrobiotus metropolitanus TaxID=2943436 RepID=UPI002445BD81|nr:uncharacterized protein LOC129602151 [Paramacrobiotus metropolitanus]
MTEGKALAREQKIGKFYVDGYDEEAEIIYEFYGDFWHGNPATTKRTFVNPHLKQTMENLHAATVQREIALEQMGYSVIKIWESEYDQKLAEDEDFRETLKDIHVHAPLQPRDALYGGRTNGTRLHYKCEPGEQIRFADVISEYPFVNSRKRYPVGPHVRITADFDANLENYFGLFYLTILPPKCLWLPVLPYRTEKLTFPLCRLCAETQQNSSCHHTDAERSLTGVWCSVEIIKALSLGYTVIKVYEIWHFPSSREGLFKEYIQHFLKLKTEASGWPSNVKTEEERKLYMEEFLLREGVSIDAEKVEKNLGLRALAKLFLNNFWGRLGMREDRLSTQFISEPKDFYELLLNDALEIHNIEFFSDTVIQVAYKSKEDFIPVNPKTNVILAA